MPSRSSSSSRSCGSASGTCSRTCARAASPSRSATPVPARSSRVTAWKGTSRAWDSQKVQNTSTPRPAASAAASRATRDLPMPGGPTTFTTPPRPPIARSAMASRAAISQRRPTRLASARPTRPSRGPIATSRRARTGSSAPLMRTHSGSASITVCSTSRAVDSDSITPPGGATDSIRCAIPTVLAGRGVSQRPRTDLTGDHPTRIQAHPHLQSHAVAALHLGRQPVRLLLDGQRGQACPKSVILQRNWGAEQRHHPVAGVLHASRRSAAPPPPSAPPARS